MELIIPVILLFSTGGTSLVVGLWLMVALHTFITSNVPMAVPIEWNFMVVYGGFALFWAHPDITIFDVGSPAVAAFLVVMLLVIPFAGNLFPRHVSFLMAMRYYAGNWAYGVWLFRGESYRKLDALTTSAAFAYDQLHRFYDHSTTIGLLGKVMGFRLMHLHGRALPFLLPKAVDDLNNYEYLDGEIIAGQVLGWNFGDGHLHTEQLLSGVQKQCGFEDGELRCIFVEAQPMGGKAMEYRIVDAKRGLVEKGKIEVAALRKRQPWSAQ